MTVTLQSSIEIPNRTILCTRAYAPVAVELAKLSGWPLGEVRVKDFPDGERYQQILTEVDGKSIVLVAGTASDEHTLELFDLACAVVKYGARRLELIVPYFAYSTMERATKRGEVVTAKTRARLLSAIPRPSQGTRLFFLDLHAEGIPHYMEGEGTAFHVYGKSFVKEAALQLAGEEKNFVFASTDAGRAKWVQSLANDMKVDASFVYKKRTDGSTTVVTAVNAHVQDRHVLIYDDMIRTGGSLLQAARAYQTAGARKIDVIATHGLFPGDALKNLQASGVIGQIHVTDSHPRIRGLESDFLKVHPVAPIFYHALVHNQIGALLGT
jgi:ribose-phosphate pyrophosphokinase